jgi:hypothetical protein
MIMIIKRKRASPGEKRGDEPRRKGGWRFEKKKKKARTVSSPANTRGGARLRKLGTLAMAN